MVRHASHIISDMEASDLVVRFARRLLEPTLGSVSDEVDYACHGGAYSNERVGKDCPPVVTRRQVGLGKCEHEVALGDRVTQDRLALKDGDVVVSSELNLCAQENRQHGQLRRIVAMCLR